MKTNRQTVRDAKQLFRLCQVNGKLDEDRAREVVQAVLLARRRGYLALLGHFKRLLKLDCDNHTARVESAQTLPPDLQTTVRIALTDAYGPEITPLFADNPELIGGMRIQVGSDVYDGSVQSGLAALEKRFGIRATNGSHNRN